MTSTPTRANAVWFDGFLPHELYAIKLSRRLNVYDAKTRQYLRPATVEDLKKWNDVIEAGARWLAN